VATTQLTANRTCRVLYYGPASAGKRANLRVIHRSIPPEQRLAVATDDPERQIAFRVRHGAQGEWQVLVQAMDAGRERPRAAGRDLHAPCDGIVFVVDSGASMLDQSLAALESLKTWLESWDLDLMRIPIVIQYNRRDRPDTLPVDRLESLLNPWGLLSFPANAANGDGARETLKAILGLAVNHLAANPAAAALARASASAPQAPQAAPSPPQAPTPARNAPGALGIDYGPPVPGAEFGETTRALSEAIYHELRPTVVVPVRIPRRLLTGREPVRLLLEVQVDDDTPY
jgi:hypothetical protein